MSGSIRNKVLGMCLGAVLALTAVGTANAVLITFDEFPVGTEISTQYLPLGVEFSVVNAVHSDRLPVISIDGPQGEVLSPNPPYEGDFWMLFTVPVYCLSFDAGFWNLVGDPTELFVRGGWFEVRDPWGGFLGTVTNQFTHEELGGFVYEHFDLSGFGLIGSVRFDSYHDPLGGALDNLNFCPVPEPGTIALFGTGLVGLAGLRRRNRKR